MIVASLDLCKELSELSGWNNNAATKPKDRLKLWQQSYSTWEMGQGNPDYNTTPPDERRGVNIGEWRVVDDNRYVMVTPSIGLNPCHWYDDDVQKIVDASIPAYTLGYLLMKLPRFINNGTYRFNLAPSIKSWLADYSDDDGLGTIRARGDTPEDATAKLAIELFKQGVLTKDK